MDCHVVVEARHVFDHTVWLKFCDETAGEIELSSAPVLSSALDTAASLSTLSRRNAFAMHLAM